MPQSVSILVLPVNADHYKKHFGHLWKCGPLHTRYVHSVLREIPSHSRRSMLPVICRLHTRTDIIQRASEGLSVSLFACLSAGRRTDALLVALAHDVLAAKIGSNHQHVEPTRSWSHSRTDKPDMPG